MEKVSRTESLCIRTLFRDLIRPQPPALFYVVGIGLAFGLTLLFNSFTKKFSKTFSKWKSSKDSQEPVSTLEADRSVEARERPSGGHIVSQCESHSETM